MGCNVFVNSNEISCKASGGKVIAAFPDVCLSPPTPPAGPIPIPYPVTSMASDTADGSSTVKVGGQPVMLKSQSYFSKCTGDEAATKSQGMGVVSHQIQGKVYFAAWSMDVKIEGQNADRHLDLMTSNHASPTQNTGPLPEMANMDLPANMTPCACVYKRARCKKTPNTKQTKHVASKSCWRPNCLTPNQGPMIADHQPSLVERWYKGGCNDPNFCANATSTPGDPPGSTEYHQLLPRCRGCYWEVYANIGMSPPLGKNDTPEGLMEAAKSRNFQQQMKDKFNVEPADC